MTDNARKVFDMLGVEPNEEFNMLLSNSSSPLKCKIDENLEGYYLMFGRWELYDKLIIDLFNSRMKIIKLPKEPKKKKLRDLTQEEWDKWKDNNCASTYCGQCIFRHTSCAYCYEEDSWINNKDLYSDKFLDQEIKVED